MFHIYRLCLIFMEQKVEMWLKADENKSNVDQHKEYECF